MFPGGLFSLPNRESWLNILIDRICGGTPRGKRLHKIWEDYGRRCHYCRELITLNQASRDHAIPKSRGGTNHPSNIRLSCKTCNSVKQNMTEEEYWETLDFDRRTYGSYLKRPLKRLP